MTGEQHVFCENCKHYKGDGEHCVDSLTIAIAGVPLRNCDGFEPGGDFA
jgi:hypothetical protein